MGKVISHVLWKSYLRLFCCIFLAGFFVLPQAFSQNLYRSLDIQTPNRSTLDIRSRPKQLTESIHPFFPALKDRKSELFPISQKESPGGIHMSYEQQVNGIPIYGAKLKLNIDKQGNIYSSLSSLKQGPYDIPQTFKDSFDRSKFPGIAGHSAKKYWFEENGSLVPIFQFYPTESSENSEEILIHAVSGEIISSASISANFHYHPNQDTSGRGLVFLPNPCTKAEVAYGDLFTDANDTDQDILNQLRDTVVLQGLTFENDVFKLEGPYVRIVNINERALQPVTSQDGDFFLTREEEGFEEVMAYYHIDTFQRYVQSLGFHTLQGLPLRVDPHWELSFDNSKFEPLEVDPFILLGTFGVDDAEDADVIIHEYAHALSYFASGRTNSGSLERRGLDEGVADYFASRYSEDLSDFEFQKIFNWDGHNEFWPGRTTASTRTYPSTNNIFVHGELWSSTLMQIRADVGKEVTDRLVLQSLFANVGGMSLMDGVFNLLDADTLLYNGANSEAITFHFCQRGILVGETCIAVNNAPIVEQPIFRVYPNPSRGEITVEIGDTEEAVLEVIDQVGRQVFVHELGRQQKHTLRLPIPPGMYMIKVQGKGGDYFARKIYIQ